MKPRLTDHGALPSVDAAASVGSTLAVERPRWREGQLDPDPSHRLPPG